MDRCIVGRDAIDWADFAKPTDILYPAFKYPHNVIIQHTTLYLHQVIRYMVCRHELGTLIGSTGVCAGLLPAAAAVTGGSSAIPLISRSCDFFQVALWIGVRSEQYRRNKLMYDHTGFENATQSCSYVVEEVTKEVIEELLTGAEVIAVQDSVLLEVGRIESAELVSIVNYGPGLGMRSTAAHALGRRAEVRGAEDINPPTPVTNRPGLAWEDIAIVGMAVDLPGAPNADLLWELLSTGRNTVSEIPANRFDTGNYRHTAGEKCSFKSKFGNFLEQPFLFDAEHFNISPREARSMDPQQRVLLQTAYRALEGAGYVPDASPSFARDTFGCWIGNSTLDYIDNLGHNIDVFTAQELFAHFSVRGYRAVNVITSPDMYLGLDRAHFLSPSGQCKSFDTSADGYCRAEGCGVFVIKRLSAALKEGDRIHAVIKAIEINQSGDTHPITHPHVPTQQALFEKLLRESKINPNEISVVEMHGTGTQAGDPNEVDSVRRVLCRDGTRQNSLHLTSIKANIGHSGAVSGISGLAKLILMMKHDRIPAQISFKSPNPRIRPLGVDGAVIDANGAVWPPFTGKPRLGMLNNFGAGGSNAAAIIGEHIAVGGQVNQTFSGITFVCGFSAKTKQAILKLRKRLATDLQARLGLNSPSLADVCATLTSRRQLYSYRMAVTARTLAELVDKLHTGIVCDISKSLCTVPEAVFLFTGQGSQYLGMGIILAERNDGCSQPLDAAAWQGFQSATFVLEVALAKLIVSWGIRPQAVAGHSLGEFAALVPAGVVSLRDGLKLVARQAQLMAGLCQLREASMLALNYNTTLMEDIINEIDEFSSISIACNNSATDCVVGGPVLQLAQLKKHLTALGVRSKALDVPLAFHTAAVDPILQQFTAFAVDEVAVSPPTPKIRVVSNLLGRTVAPGEPAFSGDYFAKQCRGVVAFDAGLKDLLEKSNRDNTFWRWIEIGPHPSIQPMARSRLSSLPTVQVLLPTLVKNVPASTAIALLLEHFYETSIGVNWRKVFSHKTYRYKLIELPLIPFFKSEYYVPHREMAFENTVPHRTAVGNSMPGCSIKNFSPAMDSDHAIYDTQAVLLKELIGGHVVCGYALCPASVYHDMVFAALQETKPGKNPFTVQSHMACSDPDRTTIHCTGIATQLDSAGSADSPPAKAEHSVLDVSIRIYCSNFDVQDSNGHSFAIADAYAVENNGLLAIFKGMKFQQVKVAQISQALRMAALPSKKTTAALRTSYQQKYVENLPCDETQAEDSASETAIGALARPPRGMPIRILLAKVCGQSVERLTPEVSLDALGMDTLLFIELSMRLSSIGVDISIESLASCVTLADVEDLCVASSPTPWDRGVDSHRHTCSYLRADSSADSSTTVSDSKATRAVDMTNLIASICGVMPGTVVPDSELRGLGMDSLLTMELSYRLEKLYGGITLPLYMLKECHTVRDIERLVNKQRGANILDCGAMSASSSLAVRAGGQATEHILQLSTKPARSTQIDSEAVRSAITKALHLSHQPEVIQKRPASQNIGSCSTLFLVHDGSGICSHYRRLKSLNRLVLALHDPKFVTRTENECSWPSLSAMAAHYASIISSTTDDIANESCILAGWSFGGVVAFETARILMARGYNVKGVILIDSPPPVDHIPLSDAIISAVTAPLSATGGTNNSDSGNCISPTTATAIRKLVIRSFKACASLLANFEPTAESRPMPCVTLLRSAVGWTPPQGMDGRALEQTENRWLQNRCDSSLATAEWEALTGRPVECVDIPGNHFQVFDPPNIEAVSAALASACLRLESRQGTGP
ncbi:hypothetical protein NLG97_g2603 [Lecanicillium saksenae]|uniref:Uncharacterized protein n=1 Tax=Lecanicillium saksenae TaxID=468837 RepID=A0ACC1R344_9HYPO|nr:hypothetical protein NLG97_g2603 [Lecanicillium saksenae]